MKERHWRLTEQYDENMQKHIWELAFKDDADGD